MKTSLLGLGTFAAALSPSPASACPAYACDYTVEVVSGLSEPVYFDSPRQLSRFVRFQALVVGSAPSDKGFPLCRIPIGNRRHFTAFVDTSIGVLRFHAGQVLLLSHVRVPPGRSSMRIEAVLR